jgi:hypothetical protein
MREVPKRVKNLDPVTRSKGVVSLNIQLPLLVMTSLASISTSLRFSVIEQGPVYTEEEFKIYYVNMNTLEVTGASVDRESKA